MKFSSFSYILIFFVGTSQWGIMSEATRFLPTPVQITKIRYRYQHRGNSGDTRSLQNLHLQENMSLLHEMENTNPLLRIRGGGQGKREDEDSDAFGTTTKTALSVVVGLAALSIIAKQPIIHDFLGNLGLVERSGASSSPSRIPAPPPPPRVTSSSKNSKDKKNKEVSDLTVIVKTTVSVTLTTLGLFGLLYAAQTDAVTNFYAKLGLPEQIGGISPVLYITFWFLTFAGSAVTDIVSSVVGVSTAFQQSLRPTEVPSAEWYASIPKPSWNPPGWVFAVMWLLVSKPTQFLALRQMFLPSTLAGAAPTPETAAATAADVAAAATSAAAAMTENGSSVLQPSSVPGSIATSMMSGSPNWMALGVYCLHLALGNSWNDVFFGFKKVSLGLDVMLLFWTALVMTALLFYQENQWAGYFMLPTCAWVTVATALNWSINSMYKKEMEFGGRRSSQQKGNR